MMYKCKFNEYKQKINNVKYVYLMMYCNTQFINFGDKGIPGFTAYILLHRSLAVLSIILICCAFFVKEFIIQSLYIWGSIVILYCKNFFWPFLICIAPNLVYLHNLDIKKVGSVNGTSVLLNLSHFSCL